VCAKTAVRYVGGYKGYALAAHEDLVRQLVAEQPDITLAEIKAVLATEKVTVGKSSISRFLHHLHMRFKKSLRAAEHDRPDVWRKSNGDWSVRQRRLARSNPCGSWRGLNVRDVAELRRSNRHQFCRPVRF
jgi:hypothetical protein